MLVRLLLVLLLLLLLLLLVVVVVLLLLLLLTYLSTTSDGAGRSAVESSSLRRATSAYSECTHCSSATLPERFPAYSCCVRRGGAGTKDTAATRCAWPGRIARDGVHV